MADVHRGARYVLAGPVQSAQVWGFICCDGMNIRAVRMSDPQFSALKAAQCYEVGRSHVVGVNVGLSGVIPIYLYGREGKGIIVLPDP